MKRLYYLVSILFLIVMGLLSRRIPFLPAETGDALWAMTLFCFLRFVFERWRLCHVATISLSLAYLVEFSQMIRWSWLVSARSTMLGHLLLGQGFLWVDLFAYTLGIAFIWYLAYRIEQSINLRAEVRRNHVSYK